MIWRRLSDTFERICSQWREQLFSEDEWELHPEQPPTGEAQGFRVQSESVPYGAYLKPKRLNPNHTPRSANEKICADLGNDLSLPIPPALLYEREKAGGNEEDHTVLSLYVADRVWRLKDVKSLPEPPWDLIADAMRRASGIVAFDTWIGNTDRNNDRNILFVERSDVEEERWAVFIDFSYTLNKQDRWENGGGTEVEMPAAPNRLLQNIDEQELAETVSAIEDLSEDEIREVTDRIPPEYLNDPHRETVVQSLIERAGSLRATLVNHLGS